MVAQRKKSTVATTGRERWDWWNDEGRLHDLLTLIEDSRRLGRYPTREEFRREHGDLIYTLIHNYGGTYEEACREASLYQFRQRERKSRKPDEKVEQLKPAYPMNRWRSAPTKSKLA